MKEDTAPLRVLVTGAAGFIGGHLVRALLDAGHQVVAVARSPKQLATARGLTAFPVDLAGDLREVRWPFVDAVVHLAQANVPWPRGVYELQAVNVSATVALLEHASSCGARRFVLASSGSVYGTGSRAFTETDPPAPANYYALTKLQAEQAVSGYAEDLPTSTLRLFSPYGPGQRGRLVAEILRRVIDGAAVGLNQNAGPRVTPTWIGDVVAVIVRALSEASGTHLLNVAGPDALDVESMARIVGEEAEITPVFEATGHPDPGGAMGDASRLREEFGYGPLVPFREGVRAVLGVRV